MFHVGESVCAPIIKMAGTSHENGGSGSAFHFHLPSPPHFSSPTSQKNHKLVLCYKEDSRLLVVDDATETL
jgi:hypothetical protein